MDKDVGLAEMEYQLLGPRNWAPKILTGHWGKGRKRHETLRSRDAVLKDFVVEMISELLALFLPEEMQLLYRQRRCGRHRHVISCFSWSCSAEPSQLAPVQLECETPRMTTRTRPCSPQDGWRDLKWEFLIGFSAASNRFTDNLGC
jgi:hypothetical protein